MKRTNVCGLVLMLSIIGGSVVPSPASAIPAFARRYGLTCSVCHDAWPHLNRTGWSFKLSGYRRLNGAELKPTTPDIELAQQALTIPAIPPLAIEAEFGFDFQRVRRRAEDGTSATRTGSSFDVGRIEILAGAPLGRHLSFFLLFEPVETEIERPTGPGEANDTGTTRDITFETEGPDVPALAKLSWNSLLPQRIAPLDSLNITGGIDELPLAFSPEYRRLSVSPYLVYTRRALDLVSRTPLDDLLSEDENRRLLRLSDSQTGVDFSGLLVLGGGTLPDALALEYHLGVTNGSNKRSDPNTDKDLFGRLAVSWQGQTLGIFGYWSPDIYADDLRQDASIAVNPDGVLSGLQRHNRFYSIGPDLTLSLAPLAIPVWLETQVLFNHESNPTAFDKRFDWWGGFSQLHWKIVPPLIAYGRYEWIQGDRFDDTAVGGNTGPVRPREWAAVVGLQWYVLENLRLLGEYSRHEFRNRLSRPSEQRVEEDIFALRAILAF